jgi:hypothetical protein
MSLTVMMVQMSPMIKNIFVLLPSWVPQMKLTLST